MGILTLFAWLSTACAFGQVDKPTVSILSPGDGATLRINQAVMVQSVSVSRQGIDRVELWVNGERKDTKTAQSPRSFTAIQSWTPRIEGTYRLELRAFDTQSQQNNLAIVSVSVLSSSAEDDQAVINPVSDETMPNVTAKRNLNIRAGPGVSFDILRTLRSNESAQIIGSNEDRSWWKIAYSGTSSGTGWVSADEKYAIAKNVAAVPVVNVPIPTVTATSISILTPTPQTNLPQIHYFQANKQNITTGENVLLSWDLDNAQAAYLYPGGEAGVVAPASLQVNPTQTTTYRLVAQNQYGEVEAQVTVTIP